MSDLPIACVVGAGSSGITAAKALHDRGIPFDCFEKSDRVGGNWVFGNTNGMSSAYRSLHINTSRQRMEYSDYPMPTSYPDFPHHTHIASYFDSYVDHFGFRDKIIFETGVEHAERGPDGVWTVTPEAARPAATTRSWSPMATTGIRAGPSRPTRAASTASRCTPITTSTTRVSATRTCSWWASATVRWTSLLVDLCGAQDLPLVPARGLHPTQVPVRQAPGPDRRPTR